MAIEMLVYIRILRIHWTNRLSNEVSRQMGKNKTRLYSKSKGLIKLLAYNDEGGPLEFDNLENRTQKGHEKAAVTLLDRVVWAIMMAKGQTLLRVKKGRQMWRDMIAYV